MLHWIQKRHVASLAILLAISSGVPIANAQGNQKVKPKAEKVKPGSQIGLGHPGTPDEQAIKNKADALAAAALAGNGSGPGGVGLVIEVIAGDQRMILTYGETKKGNGQKPTAATIFQIGSVTKTFTATILAAYVQKHLVAYSDRLQQYVPSGTTVPSLQGRAISLLDLSTHTSGLPRKAPNLTYPTQVSELYSFLNTYTLTDKPGTVYLYSNLGFALLAHALTKAGSEAEYMNLVEKEIDQPLGLVDTTTQLSDPQKLRRAQGYDPSGNPASYEMSGFPAGNGAGALYSTANDMMKYLSFNMGLTQTPLNSLLPDLQKDWRPVNGKPGKYVGLAWQITEGPPRMIWKNGTTYGFHTFVGFYRDQKVGVVVLSNSLQLNSTQLGNSLLKFLSNHPDLATDDLGDADGLD